MRPLYQERFFGCSHLFNRLSQSLGNGVRVFWIACAGQMKVFEVALPIVVSIDDGEDSSSEVLEYLNRCTAHIRFVDRLFGILKKRESDMGFVAKFKNFRSGFRTMESNLTLTADGLGILSDTLAMTNTALGFVTNYVEFRFSGVLLIASTIVKGSRLGRLNHGRGA